MLGILEIQKQELSLKSQLSVDRMATSKQRQERGHHCSNRGAWICSFHSYGVRHPGMNEIKPLCWRTPQISAVERVWEIKEERHDTHSIWETLRREGCHSLSTCKMPLKILTYFPGTLSWPHPPGFLLSHRQHLGVKCLLTTLRSHLLPQSLAVPKSTRILRRNPLKNALAGLHSQPLHQKAPSTQHDMGSSFPGVASGVISSSQKCKRFSKLTCFLSHPFNPSLHNSTPASGERLLP